MCWRRQRCLLSSSSLSVMTPSSCFNSSSIPSPPMKALYQCRAPPSTLPERRTVPFSGNSVRVVTILNISGYKRMNYPSCHRLVLHPGEIEAFCLQHRSFPAHPSGEPPDRPVRPHHPVTRDDAGPRIPVERVADSPCGSWHPDRPGDPCIRSHFAAGYARNRRVDPLFERRRTPTSRSGR